MKLIPLTLIFVISISLLICACKKDNNGEPPGEHLTRDSLIIFKTNFTEKDTLQNIVMDAESDLDIYLYGKRNADSKITGYSSMIVRNRLRPDTAINLLFDDSSRISAYYGSVKQVNDTSLYTIGYNDNEDSVSICRYLVDWSTGTRTLRTRVKMKKQGNGYSVDDIANFRTLPQNPMADVQAAEHFIPDVQLKAGNFILVAVAGVVGFYTCGPYCAAAGALVGIVLALSNASAAELTQIPNAVPLNIKGQKVFAITVKDIFRARNWKMASWHKNGVNVATVCETGPTWTFNQNNTISLSGPNTCYPAIINYNLYNNDQNLYIGDGDLTNWTIKELSTSKIVLSLIDDSTPANILNVITFTGL